MYEYTQHTAETDCTVEGYFNASFLKDSVSSPSHKFVQENAILKWSRLLNLNHRSPRNFLRGNRHHFCRVIGSHSIQDSRETCF